LVRLLEVAHLAWTEHAQLSAGFETTLAGGLVEVDLAQGDTAAVHEALATNAGQEADLLVEVASLLPLVGPMFFYRQPIRIVMKWASCL